MNKPLRLIFAGTPDFAASALANIIAHQKSHHIEVVAVYTQPDRKAGRGQKLTASAVKQLALSHDIVVEQPLTFKKSTDEGQQAREKLQSHQADVMVVAAYGLILPLGVLNTPTFGCLNIHASLLPRWRGAAPIHRAILAGDSQTGVTIMQMDKGLDTGDMLHKVICDINQKDTSATLHDRLASLGADAILQVLSNLTHYQASAEKQDDTQAIYAEKLTKAEGKIDWAQTATSVNRHIRGLQPWPTAHANLQTPQGEQTIKVIASELVESDQTDHQHDAKKYETGEVVSVGKKGVLVACGHDVTKQQTFIQLTRLQWPGKKAYDAADTANSQRIHRGDRFI